MTINQSSEWPLVRIIVPVARRVSIYSGPIKRTTCYAAVVVATAFSKVWGWRVEVIDENNYHKGPLDNEGLPDHKALQRENPAQLVGFYCGLSSTMERVWDLAAFYKGQGAATMAGSWHAHNLPEETLCHNIDLVVHGDAEPVIPQIASNFTNGLPLWENAKGVSYIQRGLVRHINLDGVYCFIPDKDEALNNLMNVVGDLNDQPYADFSLVKYAKIKVYPISRTRGCGMKCEFCSVRGKGRWCSPEHFFRQIEWLVENRKAKQFFVVDDRLEEDPEGTIEVFEMVSRKYGNHLRFDVQMRLEAAGNECLIKALYKAGIRIVCIGYESPIGQELKDMHKGVAVAKMLEYTKIWRKHFRVHGMFIVGYPLQNNQPSPPAHEIYKAYKKFIKQARLDSVQILIAGPVPGSDLERRLRKEGRLLLPEKEMWNYADGNFVLFKPIGLTARELQLTALRLTRRFYGLRVFFMMAYRIASVPSLLWSWEQWFKGLSGDVVRIYGHYILRKWRNSKDHLKLLERIEKQ